ncbi:hypothetical protein T484DRAFT_2119730 [Baffinella frigidus]|nr:hypothetical protein T484DRAFT_2119730 [Cryptophyta sp. CCMP2293]
MFLPKMLGNVKMIMTTDDEAFLAALKAQKVDVIFFAPGACRFSAAKQPIPGGIETTRGWTLEEYRAAVREHQGEEPTENLGARGEPLPPTGVPRLQENVTPLGRP